MVGSIVVENPSSSVTSTKRGCAYIAQVPIVLELYLNELVGSGCTVQPRNLRWLRLLGGGGSDDVYIKKWGQLEKGGRTPGTPSHSSTGP